MASFSIQFHALPVELFSLLEASFSDRTIWITQAAGRPIRFSPWDTARKDSADRTYFLFTRSAPSANQPALTRFLDVNPGTMVLQIGRLTNEGLQESWLACKTDDAKSMARWKRAARELRTKTDAGASSFNPKTGLRGRSRSHRFSPQAIELSRSGIAMLAVGGTTILHPLVEPGQK